MKKIQLPAIGGIRKVIQPGGNVTVGTTIAEIGANSISLAQLAQLITQIQKQQQNTGGGNVGDGTEAVLVPGPGLSGGGPMLGSVPIRLTAPIPWGLDDGSGADGDPGPPGVAGANGLTGNQGPMGPAVFLDADAGNDGDPGPPGATGAAGAAGLTGSQGPMGPAVFLDAEAGADGDTGPPGPTGPTGSTGPTGNTGLTGAQGPLGPAIYLDAEAGADGDIGPPGPPGKTGPTGTNSGAYPYLLGDGDNYNDDQGFFRGNPTSVGPMVFNGVVTINALNATTALIVNGSMVIPAPSSGIALSATATASNGAFVFNDGGGIVIGAFNSSNAGGGYLQFLRSGTVKCFLGDASQLDGGTLDDFSIRSQAALGIATGGGNRRLTIDSNGAATFSSSVSIKGATPPVTAGQTALGITTTATVITTVGGISLPALASTFWVVNVNGVAYGIPCFAL